MSAIEFGSKQVIQNCLKVQNGEKVILITDRELEKLGDAIIGQAQSVGAEVQKFLMEDYGERSLDGSNPLPFPDEIRNAMKNAQVSVFIAKARPGELTSFRMPMKLDCVTGT